MKITHPSLPADYINYDLLAGVDALEVLEVNTDAFNSLRAFHLQHQDWLFGYLSYDLKNEVEQLNSKNHDGIWAASLSFFIPKYVLLLKGNKLEIHTYETKENCEQFLVKLEINSEEQTSGINLQQRESKDVYLQKIAQIKRHIQRGDIYEMNYCQEFFAKEINSKSYSYFSRIKQKYNYSIFLFFKVRSYIRNVC